MDLDKYLRLKDRVEARMRLTVMTSTGDDDYINENEPGDLAYREKQLKQMQTEVLDLEDVDGNVSITDLGLHEFRMDLVEYHKANPDIEHVPTGINAIVEGEIPGILFVLRNVNSAININGRNQIHPYYLVHVQNNGRILHGHLEPKACLDLMRSLCKGKDQYDARLCDAYNKATRNGKDMRHASSLLDAAVSSIVQQEDQSAAESLFGSSLTTFLDQGVQAWMTSSLSVSWLFRRKRHDRDVRGSYHNHAGTAQHHRSATGQGTVDQRSVLPWYGTNQPIETAVR